MQLISLIFEYWPLLILLFVVWFSVIYMSTKWHWFKEEKETIKTTTEILAVLVAAVWVYETFIYSEWIKPALQPPHVVLKSSAEVIGKKGNFHIVKIESSLKNTSKIKVDILSYWMDVYAYSIVPTNDKQAFTSNLIAELNAEKITRQNVYARDYAQSSDSEIIQIFNDDWWLEAEEDISAVRTVFISDKYDVAQIYLHARTTKNKHHICLQWGVNDANGEKRGEVKPLTYLKTGGKEKCRKEDGYDKFDAKNSEHLALRNKYGLSTTESKIELPLIQN